MATLSDIKKILHSWIRTTTFFDADHVRWHKQPEKGSNLEAVQPKGAYAEFSILTGPIREGISDEHRSPKTGSSNFTKTIITGQRLLTINVEVFGPGAFDYVVELQNSLQTDDVRESFKQRQQTTIEVTSLLSVGSVYIIYLDGFLINYTVESGDDIKAVRDGLALAMALEISDTGISPSAGATDALLVMTGKVGKEFDFNLGNELDFDSQVNAVDLAILGDEGIIDLSELEDTSWESRFSMDILLRTHTAIFLGLADTSYIENAEITGTVDGLTFVINIDT